MSNTVDEAKAAIDKALDEAEREEAAGNHERALELASGALDAIELLARATIGKRGAR